MSVNASVGRDSYLSWMLLNWHSVNVMVKWPNIAKTAVYKHMQLCMQSCCTCVITTVWNGC